MDIVRIKTIFVYTVALSLIAFSIACSRNGADEQGGLAANSDTGAEVSAASITDANIALAEGSRLLDENQTERAIEFLEHAVTLDPDLAEAHFKLGIAYALLEMQYEQEGVVTESSPSNANAPRKTRSVGSFERAVKAYEKWIDTHPEDDSAYYYLGRTYSKLMKDEEAEKAFKQAVKLKSEDTEYQTELGAILVKLAKYHEAIPPLKKAIELDPENVRAEELLEDAQAGRQRIDYVSKPDANANKQASKTANSNIAADTNSNSSLPSRPSNTNSRPPANVPKKPVPTATRSN